MQIWFKFCETIIKIVGKHYNIPKNLYQYCANVVQILCKCCTSIVQMLHKYQANIVQLLSKYCTIIEQILYKYCENIVQNVV